jgi:hypothetical protein
LAHDADFAAKGNVILGLNWPCVVASIAAASASALGSAHYLHYVGRQTSVFRKEQIAVFGDGCFWHGCPIHARPTKSHTRWWADKIHANKERDCGGFEPRSCCQLPSDRGTGPHGAIAGALVRGLDLGWG